MSVYVVTWNLNRERSNYNVARDAFIAQINNYRNKADSGLESVRFISTTQTANEIEAFLRQKLDNNDRLFVTRLRSGEYQGWLSKDVWEWINQHI